MKKRLHKLLFYALLFGVYGIFFSVECFYNFEGQGTARNIVHFVHLVNSQERHLPVAQATPFHSAAAHSIRLNKRFHQENIPPCPVLLPVAPEYVVAPLTVGRFWHTDLPDPALLHRPLRGPPALG